MEEKGLYDHENKGDINRRPAEDGAARSATPGSSQTHNLTTNQLCAYNPDMDDKTVSAVMSFLGRKGGRPPIMRPCPKCARVVSARAMQYPCPAHTSAAARRSLEKIFSSLIMQQRAGNRGKLATNRERGNDNGSKLQRTNQT